MMKIFFSILIVLVISTSVYVYFKLDDIFLYFCKHDKVEIVKWYFKFGYKADFLKKKNISIWNIVSSNNDLMNLMVQNNIGLDTVPANDMINSDCFTILFLAYSPNANSKILMNIMSSNILNKVFKDSRMEGQFFNNILSNVSQKEKELIIMTLSFYYDLYIIDGGCTGELFILKRPFLLEMMNEADLIDESAIDDLPRHINEIKYFEDSKIKNEVINKIHQYALENALKRNSKKEVIEKIQNSLAKSLLEINSE